MDEPQHGIARTPPAPLGDLSTTAVHAGRPPREPDAPLNAPIVPASAFIAGGPMEYARDAAPTTAALEAAIGALEGGFATCFASGMAAANAVMDLVPAHGVVVAPTEAYTGVAVRLRELRDAGRIDLRTVDVTDAGAITRACDGAALLWLESPTNPLMDVADVPAAIASAHRAGAQCVVDNTFATPVLQRPLADGADFVLHSLTKAISGHSDLLGGAVVTGDAGLAEQLRQRRVFLGGAPSAFDAFLALRGLRTLPLRVERAQASARDLAEHLSRHPAVGRVRYPGWGTMLAIELASVEACDELAARVRTWTHATSLGGVESLLERRRRWAKEAHSVPETLMRLSVGIENIADLWADLEQALEGLPAAPGSTDQADRADRA